MARKKKYGIDLKIRTCRFREDVNCILAEMPNASQFIQQAVDEKLALCDDTILQLEVDREKLRLRSLEEQALVQKREIDKKESLLQRKSLKRAGSQELRIKWLTKLSGFGDDALKSWLASRIDVIVDCGFTDVEEAMKWMRTNKK